MATRWSQEAKAWVGRALMGYTSPSARRFFGARSVWRLGLLRSAAAPYLELDRVDGYARAEFFIDDKGRPTNAGYVVHQSRDVVFPTATEDWPTVRAIGVFGRFRTYRLGSTSRGGYEFNNFTDDTQAPHLVFDLAPATVTVGKGRQVRVSAQAGHRIQVTVN